MQSLLLALANPYGFLPGQLGQVIRYLQEYSQWTKITDVAPVHRLAGVGHYCLEDAPEEIGRLITEFLGQT